MNDLRLIVLDNIEELGNNVNEHLKEINNNPEEYIIPIKRDRFSNGEGKISINGMIRDKDIFILSDVGNYFNERIDGVPFYVIGEEYFSGFSVEGSSASIKQAIKDAYNDSNYKDVVAPFIRSNKVDNDSDFGDTDDTINENETDNNEDNSNDDKEISNKEDKEDSNIISFSKDDLIEYGKYVLVILIVIAFIVILAKLFL